MIRIALQRTLRDDNPDARQFKQRFPQFFEPLDEELAVCTQVMGPDLFTWLADKVATLPQLAYKGKTVAMFLDDADAASLLYEDGLAFTTDYPIEEEPLADKFKKASTVVDFIKRRRAEEARVRSAAERPR